MVTAFALLREKFYISKSLSLYAIHRLYRTWCINPNWKWSVLLIIHDNNVCKAILIDLWLSIGNIIVFISDDSLIYKKEIIINGNKRIIWWLKYLIFYWKWTISYPVYRSKVDNRIKLRYTCFKLVLIF